MTFPSSKEIIQAHSRISEWVHRTPVLTSSSINLKINSELLFKCENFQKVGAFKFRGATNAILNLNHQERALGVTTHSSGNHGQALALAARLRGIKSYVVMPDNAPRVKKEAVLGYQAQVIYCESTLEAREATVNEVIREHGATLVHPYNDYRIICGQATSAKELIEDTTALDYIVCPVGGGGLISGTALSAKYFAPELGVYGAEPQGADDAFRSLKAGRIIPSTAPNTIADGLLTSLGDKTFPIINEFVRGILTVSDEEIISAMKLLWERMKIVVEPSGAVPLAAVWRNRAIFENKRVGIILTGGNVDLANLPFE